MIVIEFPQKLSRATTSLCLRASSPVPVGIAMGNTPGLMEQRVLISDATDPSCVEILREAGLSVDYKPGTSPEELLRIIPVSCSVSPPVPGLLCSASASRLPWSAHVQRARSSAIYLVPAGCMQPVANSRDLPSVAVLRCRVMTLAAGRRRRR